LGLWVLISESWYKVLGGLLASKGDTFEALEPSDALLDARTRLIESACEKGWCVALVGFVRNDGSYAAHVVFTLPPAIGR
jgi:hypothetical protein